MAIKLGWCATRSDAASVKAALGHPSARTDGEDYVALHATGDWVVLRWVGWGFSNIYHLAEAASAAGPTVAFFVLEQAWSYRVYEDGRAILDRRAYGEDQPVLSGDAAHAEQLLGLPAGTLVDLNIGDPLGDLWHEDMSDRAARRLETREEELIASRAAFNNDIDLVDEWGHLAIATACGFELPEGEGEPLDVTLESEGGRPDLPVVHRFDPVEFRATHGLDGWWSKTLDWWSGLGR